MNLLPLSWPKRVQVTSLSSLSCTRRPEVVLIVLCLWERKEMKREREEEIEEEGKKNQRESWTVR